MGCSDKMTKKPIWHKWPKQKNVLTNTKQENMAGAATKQDNVLIMSLQHTWCLVSRTAKCFSVYQSITICCYHNNKKKLCNILNSVQYSVVTGNCLKTDEIGMSCIYWFFWQEGPWVYLAAHSQQFLLEYSVFSVVKRHQKLLYTVWLRYKMLQP